MERTKNANKWAFNGSTYLRNSVVSGNGYMESTMPEFFLNGFVLTLHQTIMSKAPLGRIHVSPNRLHILMITRVIVK